MSEHCSIGIILDKVRQPAWHWNFAHAPEKAHGGWLEIHCNRPDPHPTGGEHWHEDEQGIRVTWQIPAGAVWIA